MAREPSEPGQEIGCERVESLASLRDQTASEIGSAYPYAIGLSGKLIIPSSIIEQSRLHGPGCYPDRDLSGSRRLAPIMSRWGAVVTLHPEL